MKRKLLLQICSLLSIIAFVSGCDYWFYKTFTVRFTGNPDNSRKVKSIELDRYLPFEDETEIVRQKGSLQFTVSDYEAHTVPVIDGAAALYPVFSAFVYATCPEEAVVFDGTDFTRESCLWMNNTIPSYREVVDGDADIVFCAPPSKEQLAYAEEKGVTLIMEPVGREAFVFLVNAKNPVDSLSIDELRGIYSGSIKNWKELGGEDKRIEPIQRNRGSGSQTTFLKVMGDVKPMPFYAGLPGSAIGFSFRFYVEEVVREGDVKLLSINGYPPEGDHLLNDDYPFVSEFYAVYRADNANENVERFIEWVQSDEGQDIVEKTGYIRVT